jgi:hypothetical protein
MGALKTAPTAVGRGERMIEEMVLARPGERAASGRPRAGETVPADLKRPLMIEVEPEVAPSTVFSRS